MEITSKNIDKQLKWENWFDEHVGDESIPNHVFRDIEAQMCRETNDERHKILDMIYWITDKLANLLSAKKTFNKYKELNDPNKSFEYIFKKLPKIVHYNDNAKKAFEMINKQAMLQYEKILELCLEDEQNSLNEWKQILEKFDKK